mmetsp:Transcript_28279/g.74620  ORF Transcript_28279/g.74620 Transcript_28279/m.74620 type:complete len:102 (+) Transcript_28279:471-776(+)
MVPWESSNSKHSTREHSELLIFLLTFQRPVLLQLLEEVTLLLPANKVDVRLKCHTSQLEEEHHWNFLKERFSQVLMLLLIYKLVCFNIHIITTQNRTHSES